jgi:hypothetical protein
MHRLAARFLLALAALAAALPSGAAFHLFIINELYSNADGSVQYIELTALAGGQQFTQGHSITASSVGVTHSLTLGSNLPGDTSGHRFLIGTASVTAAFGVTPDYIIPANFLFIGGGIVNWGESSDVYTHPALPTNGNALHRTGNQSTTASPQNFAGTIGTPAPVALSYQALWWASPAGSENGWGVNVTHQGNTLFATWFTYDLDGSPMWLVMSNGDRTSNGVYTGQLFRTTGPAFNAVPFNPASVVVTPVGSATFTFTSATAGSFAYTVNGITQTKQITRQEYAAPVPTCTPGGTPGTPPNYQDLWWRSPAASESGWGVNITHQGNTLFATWFTYAADGKGMWLVMSNGDRTAEGVYTGALFRTRGNAFNSVPWNSSTITVTPVGTGTFTFTDANNGTFAYTVDGISQTKAIIRQVYASPVSICK